MRAFRQTLSRVTASLALSTWCLTTPLTAAAQGSDADAMDKLLGPVALYPDPLLAQVLTSATSPDQVTKFHTWLDQQTTTGSDLQQAAMNAGFEASFASLAVFPQVVSTMAVNIDWTKELGTAYLSNAAGVTQSVQRLRAKAQAAGTLKSNQQQTVATQTQGSTQAIVIQPTNPQVVYVPTYDPQVVYAPPPQQSSGGDAALAALIGFGVGIAIGAAIDNDPPWGWGGWSVGWWGRPGVIYRRAAWVVPVRPRYPYVRPVPVYHPSRTVIAPRRTNVVVNVNNNRVNVGNQVNIGNKTNNVNNRTTNVVGGATAGDRTPNAGNRPNASANGNLGGATRNNAVDRGRSTPNVGSGRSTGAGTSALGGYGSGSSARAASSRGKASVGAGKGRRR